MSIPPELKTRIESLLASSPVVLFMKGTATQPMCGFSARAAAILQQYDIPFTDINILQDEALRQGLKIYADWPTFPQLFVQGQLVGGADIIAEMHQSGELTQLLKNVD